MKVKQLTSTIASVTIPSASDIHIGIEHLYSHPLIYPIIPSEAATAVHVPILYNVFLTYNGMTHTYVVGDNDILEFENSELSNVSMSVTPALDNTTFITIAYNQITS